MEEMEEAVNQLREVLVVNSKPLNSSPPFSVFPSGFVNTQPQNVKFSIR